jgi:hypothetical protein
MSEGNIVKYKNICINLIREDEEIKSLISTINESFVDEIFSNSIFIYKLENWLLTGNKKEKFFKAEIIDYLKLLALDIEYTQKIQNLNSSLDSYIAKIKQFDFN